jgi:hypothetical protein
MACGEGVAGVVLVSHPSENRYISHQGIAGRMGAASLKSAGEIRLVRIYSPPILSMKPSNINGFMIDFTSQYKTLKPTRGLRESYACQVRFRLKRQTESGQEP